MKTRRVGTMTLGAGLVLFGCLFLAHLFFQNLSYLWIFRLWPLLLISLGVETLWGTMGKERQWSFDTGAVLLLFLLSLFAMMMAAADFMLQTGLMYQDRMFP